MHMIVVQLMDRIRGLISDCLDRRPALDPGRYLRSQNVPTACITQLCIHYDDCARIYLAPPDQRLKTSAHDRKTCQSPNP